MQAEKGACSRLQSCRSVRQRRTVICLCRNVVQTGEILITCMAVHPPIGSHQAPAASSIATVPSPGRRTFLDPIADMIGSGRKPAA